MPYFTSHLKDFEALQNPGMRNHVIGFLIAYPGYISLVDPWFPYSVFGSLSVHLATVFSILPVLLRKPSTW